MLRLITLLTLVFVLAGCTTTSKKQLNGLMGKTIAEATISFGKAPSSHMDIGNDAHVYTWRWPMAWTRGLTGEVMHEIVTIWTDASGLIVQWQRSTEDA